MTVRTRRRSVRALERVHNPNRSLIGGLARAATSPWAKTAYVIVGSIGLAALAAALIGPERIERRVIRPLRGQVEAGAGHLWDDSAPLRDQITNLFQSAGAERDRLARSFQSWIGHFRAT